jgi:hypothetical protein
MGGDQGQGQQNQITQQQLGVEQQYLGMAQNQLTQEQTLTAPQKTYNTGVINAAESGNYSNLISAAGPATGTIAQTEKQAQEQIMNSVPAGPGRDYALAASKQGEATQMSTTLNQLFQNALQSNTNIGLASAGIGLQETGAGLNSANIASQSNQAVMSANEQAKSSTMSMIGQLAGAGGAAVSGGFAKGGAFA